MTNEALVKSIEQNFESFRPGMNTQLIEKSIRNISRDIGRIKTENKDLALRLKKIAIDIVSVYTNQVRYSDLRNKSENPGLKVKIEFDDGFFESFAILRTEFLGLVEGI